MCIVRKPKAKNLLSIFTITFAIGFGQQCPNVSLNVEYFLVSTLGEEERWSGDEKLVQLSAETIFFVTRVYRNIFNRIRNRAGDKLSLLPWTLEEEV